MQSRILIITVAAAATTLVCTAVAQQNQPEPTGNAPMALTGDSLPTECRTAVQPGALAQTMQSTDVPGAMPESQTMMATMTEAQKGYLQSMMKMRRPMQVGIMAKNPDVGFVCGMLPHHQGAIDMAKVVLKTGRNLETKKFAERVIREQSREITEMKDWLKTYANVEGH